tara:strand:- start:6618 stop:7898 length:1281 start_codon:yes stop_codon:yes gene_type:complete
MSEINKEKESYSCDCCEDEFTNGADSLKHTTNINGMETLCDDCYGEHTFYCESCNDDFPIEQSQHYGDMLYCEDCYHDYIGCCSECGEDSWRDDLIWRERAEEYYCENCDPGDGDDVDLESYNVKEMVDGSILEGQSDRHIGLEIECVTNHSDFWEMIDNGELEYSPRFRPVSDGSINVGEFEEDRGVEWVMKRPMQGDVMRTSIDTMLRYLNSGFYYINKSCGLHVHVDARDLDYQDLKWTLLLGKSAQDIIYKMMPPSRVTTRWARRIPLSREQILSIDSSEEFINSWYQAWGAYPSYDKYNDARYCGMNMHSRIINGSIEFRYHSGTLNPIKIHNWITICQKIVDTGKLLSTYCREDDMDNIISKHRYIKTLQHIIEERNLTFGNFARYLRLGVETTNYVRSRLTKFYNTEQKEDYRALEFYI